MTLPLSDLAAFAAIARERNFRTAARKRGVSPSSLSASLRSSNSGSACVSSTATTRSMTPTQAGERPGAPRVGAWRLFRHSVKAAHVSTGSSRATAKRW
ncbi:LysR family transcriptional regulator [Rhizobium sp. 007]|uniref:LysR family transcriptional regulator n=1 Tax=Rhizobium sp. 007 TaxID=2785056 RepID=UPI001FF02F3B|nr:LysR family transcriptional regulator [Rhizobium sp. 007]